MRPEALLAIRSDIAAAVEEEYLEWLTKEHTLERVGIDGFLSARIFRSKHTGFGRYLILYELKNANVLDSPAYLERLNSPTPWTTRMMPHLGNFIRGGGRIVTTLGAGYGAALVPISFHDDIDAVETYNLEALSRTSGVIAIRVLQTDKKRTAVTSSEKTLRTGDQSFDKLLMIETFDTEATIRADQTLKPHPLHIVHQEIGVPEPAYSLVFYLKS